MLNKPLILIGSFLLLFNIIETTSIAKCSRNDRKSIELETTSGKYFHFLTFEMTQNLLIGKQKKFRDKKG